MLETKAVFRRKDTEIEATDCVADKVIHLSGAKFDYFSRNLMRDWDFIRDNPIDIVVDADGRYHCLLIVGEGRRDGILVNAEGAGYARYSAFLPNARDLLAAEKSAAFDEFQVEHDSAEATISDDFESESAAWKNLTDRNLSGWREDKRYRQKKDGAFFYIGGETGQYMRIANDGRLTVGRYEFARPGIEDAVLVARATRDMGSYERAVLLAAQLGGTRFLSDLDGIEKYAPPGAAVEKPSVLEKIREARTAPTTPRKQKDGRGKEEPSL